ncbi:MAG: glycosyltransferase family 2 protein [Candidatus Cloacimonetes bacterium]|nr:glycosyltransferase family 2 protein [Candidatus Cloacimonadota bacterium]
MDMNELRATGENTAVIIPVYNGQKHLAELFRRLGPVMPKEAIIVVDDASTDGSAAQCQALGFRVHQLATNSGKGAALQAGFKLAQQAGYHFAATIDCDLQHKPEDIPRLLKKQQQTAADIIIGARQFSPATMPWPRIFSNRTTSRIVSWKCGHRIIDSQSGFRLYRLASLARMQFISHRYQFETEVIIKFCKAGCRVAFIPIDTIYNDEESHISHLRDIWNFIKTIVRETGR